jgi:hypothetical protein
MYKITTTYDGNPVPHSIHSYADALDAFDSFGRCTDWGFANEYATYNLSLPDGKMYTKNFYRNGKVTGK